MRGLFYIAHRGFAAVAPENTLPAFAAAVADNSCAGVELDVRLTADGVLVVHHDAALNPAYCRQPNGSWVNPGVLIADKTWAELSQFELGLLNPNLKQTYSYANRAEVAGVHLPSLQQVLIAITQQRPGCIVVIELKSAILKKLSNTNELLNELANNIKPFKDLLQLMVCSFDWRLLTLAAKRLPKLPLLFTTHPLALLGLAPLSTPFIAQASRPYYQKLHKAVKAGPVTWWQDLHIQSSETALTDMAQSIADLGGSYWFCHLSDYSPELLAAANKANLKVAVWGAENLNALASEQCNGVLPDMLCADYPL